MSFKNVSPVQAVDDEVREVRQRVTGLAEVVASKHADIDILDEKQTAALEAGESTDEIDAAILAATTDLERFAVRASKLEKIAAKKIATLAAKRHRLRVETLEVAEGSSRMDLAAVNKEIDKALIVVSVLFGKRLKLEHDTFGLCARLQHLTGVPRGMGNIEWTETALTAEFLRRHPEALRTMPFGEQPWQPFTLTIPVLTPDRIVAALVADDEAAST